ncbi:MAG TPA: T9SS type A sorting domain-containing protein [Bacteroidetes bacterium]|nr:T9SS type A sorting domain-containing protein [Bacteroidota bacterium]
MKTISKTVSVLISLLYLCSPIFSQVPSNIGVVNHDTVHVITWTDAQELSGETYNVYMSSFPISEITSPEVYRIGTNIPENRESYEYMVCTPTTPAQVTYYYAVTVISNGVETTTVVPGSNATVEPATGHTRWALAAIWIDGEYFQPPTVDGNLSEWEPLFSVHLDPNSPENKVALGNIDGPSDQSATCWLAMDKDNLYLAGKVIDDTLVNPIEPGASDQWKGDVVEYYLGLYDQRPSEPPHTDYQTDDEPDYEIHIKANAGTNLLNTHIYDNGKAHPGDLVWPDGEVNANATGTNGNWIYEGRLPFSALTWDDKVFPSRFVPQIGMVLPINIMTCDADDSTADREHLRQGQLSWSNHPQCKDSWDRPEVWKHHVVIYDPKQLKAAISNVEKQPEDKTKAVPEGHSLFQNYPNPFNASTTIECRLSRASRLNLDLYDLVGRLVRTLTNSWEKAGTYRIKWDGCDALGKQVSSGIYLCRMNTGNFVATTKIVLIR